ncbi:unnamed protein product [Mesocestoides corti]|uniref:Protein CASP n=3 Tax=Mesocestoides corti TaxID=53468 RepID=A0A0R3UJK6_MESCO|nr:unnamed protein product [Mesocestoides corti]
MASSFLSGTQYSVPVASSASQIGEAASSIASAQEQGRLSRRNLVEVFRKFRNSAPEEVKKAAASVLKCFQTEIDNLTARSQNAEDAFIQVYQRLVEMPDPSLALSEAEALSKHAQRASDLTSENAKLREAVNELKAEVIAARSNESLLKTAQARIAELEESSARSIEAHQKKLEEKFEEREKEVALLVSEANTRASEADSRVRSLVEALHAAQSQVFDLQSNLEEVKAGKSKELEILVEDLEKANEVSLFFAPEFSCGAECRLAYTADAGRELCVFLYNTCRLDADSHLAIYAGELANIINLMTQVHSVEAERREEVTNLRSRLEASESALQASRLLASSLEADLLRKSDYEEVKKELEVLRSIEFQQVQQHQQQSGDQSNAADEPLEFRLRRKNEQLQNRIASISADKDQMESELVELREKAADLAEQNAHQKALISRLENDLNVASTWRQTQYYEGSGVVSTAGAVEAQSPSSLVDLLSTDQDIHRPGDSSILSIVQGQRDRLRERNRELEENMLALRQQVVSAQTELESIRQDNVKLYEKIKFVQSYSPAVSQHNSPSSKRVGSQEDDLLTRYSHAYEARLNPFEQFSQQERQRRYQSLQPHEKIMHSLGKMIINNRGARLATFAYALALHLLVFLVLYKMVTSTEPLCPANASNNNNNNAPMQ